MEQIALSPNFNDMTDSGFTRDNVSQGIYSSTSNQKILNKFGYSKDDIIGLPPAAHYEGVNCINKILASSLMIYLEPAIQVGPLSSGDEINAGNDLKKSGGIKLYDFDYNKGRQEYNKILSEIGIKPYTSFPIIVVAQVEGPVTESLSNEYSESMFESLGNLNVPFLKELKFITGKDNLSDIIGDVSNYFKNNANATVQSQAGWNQFVESTKGIMDSAISGTMGGARNIVGLVEKFIRSGQSGEVIHKLLMGSGIDFPLIWQGSSFSESYSLLIRLTCPNPFDSDQYEKYVVTNLARLLAFSIPVSDSNSTYTYPLSVTAYCPGLFNLDAACITSVEIVKGLDGNDIGYNQRPGTVDVRLQIDSLYSSLVHMKGEHSSGSDRLRPTLNKYIQTMRTMTVPPNPYNVEINGTEMNNISSSNVFNNNPNMVNYSPTGGIDTPTVSSSPTDDEVESYNTLLANTGRTSVDDYREYLADTPQLNPESNIQSWENVHIT